MERPLDLFYNHLSRGDLTAAGQLLTEDSVLHVPGRSPNTGTYQGREAIVGFVAGAAQTTSNTLNMTVHRVLDDGDWSVAIATYTATRPTADGQAHLENNLAHVARFEGGLIAESWLHSRDQYEVDEFWSAAS